MRRIERLTQNHILKCMQYNGRNPSFAKVSPELIVHNIENFDH